MDGVVAKFDCAAAGRLDGAVGARARQVAVAVEVFPDDAEGRVLEVDPQEGTELRRGETVSIFARRR